MIPEKEENRKDQYSGNAHVVHVENSSEQRFVVKKSLER